MSSRCWSAASEDVANVYTSQTPTGSGSNGPFEFGEHIQCQVAGTITAIRFWKHTDESGSYTVHIWDASGTELRNQSGGTIGSGTSGWQTVSLSSSLTVTAGQRITVSVNTASTALASSNIDPASPTRYFGNGYLTRIEGRFTASLGSHPGSVTEDYVFRDIDFTADTSAGAPLYTGQTPASFGTGAFEFGTRIKATAAGNITHLRFFKPHADTITGRTITLWSTGGSSLATVTTSGEYTAGWIYGTLSSPYAVNANDEFIVSAPTDSATDALLFTDALHGSDLTNGDLTALASWPPGCFHATPGTFPNSTTDDGVFRDFVLGPLGGGEEPEVVAPYPGPAGKASKQRRRRRRYELPNGVHVYATEEEAAEFALELLKREVKVKPARQKTTTETTKVPPVEVELASDDIVRPYVRRREIPRVDQSFIAFTQRADLSQIAVEQLRQRLRRRRKAAVLLLFS